tara:strand:- start:1379 stop:2389 length:1011 start_codon:yes stop_codon:yes gene_type:complete
MALTKISRGLLSTGVSDSSDATAITIDSSEKVGIGETSPLGTLHVKTADSGASADTGADELVLENSGDTGMTIMSGTSNSGSIRFGDSADNDNGIIIYNHGSSPYMRFFVDASERMRISSAGKVGIGLTDPAAVLDVLSSGTTSTAFRVVKSGTTGQNLHAATEISGHGRFSVYDASENEDIRLDTNGTSTFAGALSKGSGSFKIDHPLESKKDTHHLYHSFIEGPQVDNLYRGTVTLNNGIATINLDAVSNMTEGTFVALNREVQCYTTNETDWDAVKGNVEGNILTISCQNTSSSATVSWLVIGERQDKNIYSSTITDENGKLIVEKLKSKQGE